MIRVFPFQVTIIIGHNDACTHVCNATMGVTKQNHFLLLSTLLHSRPTRSSGPDDLSDIDIWISMSIIYISKSKWQRNIVQRCATTLSSFHGRSMPGRTGVLAGMQEIFEGPSTSSRKTCQGLLSTWCPWQVIRLGFSSLVLGAGILRIIKVNMFFPPWYFFKTFKSNENLNLLRFSDVSLVLDLLDKPKLCHLLHWYMANIKKSFRMSSQNFKFQHNWNTSTTTKTFFQKITITAHCTGTFALASSTANSQMSWWTVRNSTRDGHADIFVDADISALSNICRK